MERARHRLRRLIECVKKNVINVVPDNERGQLFRNLTNFSKCDSYTVKLCLVSVVMYMCLSSQPVLSAEVGGGGGGGVIRGIDEESNIAKNISSHRHRDILHRESSRTNTEKGRRGEVETGESSVHDHDDKDRSTNITTGGISSSHSKKDKHSNRGNNNNCKDCQHNGTTSGRNGADHDNESEDTHKIEAILRDIFLDELEDNAFATEEDDDDEEVDHFEKSTLLSLSRHARSEPQPPLFPQGRAHQGGNGNNYKGTRAAPDEKKKKNKRTGQNNAASKKGKNKKKSSSKGSDLTKYNEYMDAVFNRMNVMIKKKRMDPLRVNLYAGPSKANQKKKNNDKNKNKKGGNNNAAAKNNNKRKHSPRMDLDSEEDEIDEDDDLDPGTGPARKNIYLEVVHDTDDDDGPQSLDEEDEDEETHEQTVRKIRAILENAGNNNSSISHQDEVIQDSEGPRGNESSKPKKPKGSTNNGTKGSKPNKDKGHNNNKKNNNNSQESSQKDKNKEKNKKQTQRQTKPTRGILHGLSSLKRDGNVAVIRQGDKVRIVRANFLLGPVALEILPKKSKSDDGEKPVAATATASKLKGILEVRLKKLAPTQIRKLRVFPPKSVKVDGGDGSKVTTGSNKRKPQQYGKVTPMATARLRQIASTVVKQTDTKKIQPPVS